MVPKAGVLSSGMENAANQLHPVIADILFSRGITTEKEQLAFLDPKLKSLSDPFDLQGMEEAVTRVLAALAVQDSIIIFGDYDVDGVTSVALLTLFFRQLGFTRVTAFLPNRMEDGYGLSAAAVERCLENHKAGLYCVVDCGTNSHAEARLIKASGADVIVLDHHEIQLPPEPGLFSALVNPLLTSKETAFCSAGICFKLAHAVLKRLTQRGGESAQLARSIDLREYLDFAAVGTVADIVPLLGDNRTVVHAGLKKLGATHRPGLQALKEVCKIDSAVTTYHVGYMLGPRLNAMGRLESAGTSLELLLSEDTGHARSLAAVLDRMNRERQDIEQRIFHEALGDAQEMLEAQPDRGTLVLGRPDWHVGVVGIVASRILREFHRPVIVVGFDESGLGKGSGRSIEGFHLVECMQSCRRHLEKFGGHAMAAGITIRQEALEDFRRAFEEAAGKVLTPEMLTPRLKIDAMLDFDGITDSFLEDLARLEPFGHSHPEPVFCTSGVELAAEPFFMGKEKQHLKLRLSQKGKTLEGVYFRYDSPFVMHPGQRLDVAFVPEWNQFRGKKTIQLKLKAIREHRAV